MARKTKTHIKNPLDRRVSMCNRKSVLFAEEDKDATCGTCIWMATNGKLEEARYESAAVGQKGANQTGAPKFTEMQRKFAASPIVTTNPRQAAIDAGYSPSYAKDHARALRQQLAPLIMEYQEQAKKLSAISVARVQTELAAMGFANIIDYFEIRENGMVLPKQLNELTREQAAAIQEVQVMDYEDEDGVTRFRIKSIKLADKRANLVELGKTLGMFNKITIEDKRESTVLMRDIPTDALEEAESLLIAAANQARRNREAKDNAVEGEYTDVTPKEPVKLIEKKD